MLYKKKWPLLIFLVPGLLFMVIFLYIPFLENIKNSFYDMPAVVKMPGTEWRFLGLDNYKRLFTDPDVRTALINSLKMMVLTVIFEVGIASDKKAAAVIPYCICFPGGNLRHCHRSAVQAVLQLQRRYAEPDSGIFRKRAGELALTGAGLYHGVYSHIVELYRILFCYSSDGTQRYPRRCVRSGFH